MSGGIQAVQNEIRSPTLSKTGQVWRLVGRIHSQADGGGGQVAPHQSGSQIARPVPVLPWHDGVLQTSRLINILGKDGLDRVGAKNFDAVFRNNLPLPRRKERKVSAHRLVVLQNNYRILWNTERFELADGNRNFTHSIGLELQIGMQDVLPSARQLISILELNDLALGRRHQAAGE